MHSGLLRYYTSLAPTQLYTSWQVTAAIQCARLQTTMPSSSIRFYNLLVVLRTALGKRHVRSPTKHAKSTFCGILLRVSETAGISHIDDRPSILREGAASFFWGVKKWTRKKEEWGGYTPHGNSLPAEWILFLYIFLPIELRVRISYTCYDYSGFFTTSLVTASCHFRAILLSYIPSHPNFWWRVHTIFLLQEFLCCYISQLLQLQLYGVPQVQWLTMLVADGMLCKHINSCSELCRILEGCLAVHPVRSHKGICWSVLLTRRRAPLDVAWGRE